MKLQLKRSNVLDGGFAKAPLPNNTDYGELAVNYNVTDPTIFLKDSDNNMVKLSLKPTSGQNGYWNRTGTDLSTANAGDNLQIGEGGFSSQNKNGVYLAANPAFANVYHKDDNSGVFARYTKYSATAPSNYTTQFEVADDGSITAAGDITAMGKLQLPSGGIAVQFNPIEIYSGAGDDFGKKIELTADGSITAVGDIQAGGSAYGTTPTEVGVSLDKDGAVVVSRESGSVFVGKTKDVTGPTSSIGADGSITTAGKIISGGDATAGANNGSTIHVGSGFSASYSVGSSLLYKGYTTGNSTPTFSVSAGGSITAAGEITSDSLNTNTLYVTNVEQTGNFNIDGSITAAGDLKNGSDLATSSGNRLYNTGGLYIRGDYGSTAGIIKYYNGGYADANVRFAVDSNGAITAGTAVFGGPVSVNRTAATNSAFVANQNGVGKVEIQAGGDASFAGTVSGTFSGNGSSITSLNATNITSGTLPQAQLSGTYVISINGNASTATTADNAGKLDGLDSTQFLRSDASDTLSGNLDVTGSLTAATIQRSDGAAGNEIAITASSFPVSSSSFFTAGGITIPSPGGIPSSPAVVCGVIRITSAVTWASGFKFAGGSAPSIDNYPAMVPFYGNTSTGIMIGLATEGIS